MTRYIIRSAAFSNVYLRMDGGDIGEFEGHGAGTVNCQFGGSYYETVDIVDAGDGAVTIGSVRFPGIFLRMDPDGLDRQEGSGSGYVNCQFGAGPWEKFRLERQSDGSVAIRSAAFNNIYLRMDGRDINAFAGRGAGTVNCQYGVGPWEKFFLDPAPYLDGWDTRPLTEAEVTAAITTYAPVLRLHPNEPYLMCSVEWFLSRARLFDRDTNTSINHPTVAQLPTQYTSEGRYWLTLEDGAKAGSLSSAKAYVHAFWEMGMPHTDLQFWFFYAYNGPGTAYIKRLAFDTTQHSADVNVAPLGEHWGDWECCTIRIDNHSKQMVGVFLSQHSSGQVFRGEDLNEFQRVNGNQIVIYSSRNGHALYAHADGNYSEYVKKPDSIHASRVSPLGFEFWLRNDTADGGSSLNCASNYEIVSAGWLNKQEPRWLDYPYRWGPEGTETNINGNTVTEMLTNALGPFYDLINILSAGFAGAAAEVIVPMLVKDNVNGPQPPKSKGTWRSEELTVPSSPQEGWAWCRKCSALHHPDVTGRCPAGGNHDTAGSANYAMYHGLSTRFQGQTSWRWCCKCGVLNYKGGPSVCTAGGSHDAKGSPEYYITPSDLPNSIGTDGRLNNDQVLLSSNRHYALVMQGDGNLVMYEHGTMNVPWSSNTSANPTGRNVLVNQADGNLVVYNDHNGAVVWAIGQGGKPRADTTLVMQDDGNLVKYVSGRGAVWASNTTRSDYHGQTDWRWCNKCGTLHYGPASSVCPAGGSHSSSGSGNYGLSHK